MRGRQREDRGRCGDGKLHAVIMSRIATSVTLALTVSTAMIAGPQDLSRRSAEGAKVDWPAVDAETLRHYQTLIRFDTTEKEKPAAEYLKRVLDENGIPAQMFSTDSDRPNVVARLKGSGRKRPLLVMGHTDTVS